MGIRLRAASVRGPGHRTDGLPNQDAVLIRRDRRGWLAVVSDGMGSRPRAAEGARAICWAARQTVTEQAFDAPHSDFVQAIYRHWLERLEAQRIVPGDAVATCLLAWGQPDGRYRLLQLGDGLILGDPAPARGLVQRDQDGFCNETTGLGISRQIEDWACARGRLERQGDALALMTDGISDDLATLEGFVPALVRQLRRRGARSARATMTRELEAWPTPYHQDDKTIALIYRYGEAHE